MMWQNMAKSLKSPYLKSLLQVIGTTSPSLFESHLFSVDRKWNWEGPFPMALKKMNANMYTNVLVKFWDELTWHFHWIVSEIREIFSDIHLG